MQFLSSEVRGLHAAVYVLASAALLSSLLALLRDRIFAHYFGAGIQLDLYYAAFRIPDLLFVCLGALVSVYMLIPELAKRGEGEQKDYLDTIITGFFSLAIVASSIIALAAPPLLQFLFPKIAAAGYLPTLVTLTRIMLLQPILLGFSNILAAITQTRHRYALYSISPLLYNLGIIFGVLVLYPLMGLPGLAWGVVLGAVLHFGIQIPSVVKDGFLQRIPRLRDARALFETAMFSVPRALALSMSQIAFIGLMALAGTLATGSIAVFMFAFNLQAVPLAIIGASYSVAAFPTLAAALSNGRSAEFIEHISAAARQILFWSLPATALIVVLRAHIVRAVLGSGAFDWTDTRLTAAALAIFSLSLVAQGLMLLLVRGYYAAGRTFMPFFVSIGVAATTVTIGVVFISFSRASEVLTLTQSIFRLKDIPGTEVLALPLAYAFASILGVLVLAFHFDRRFGGFIQEVKRPFFQAAAAALTAATAAYATLALLGPLTLASTLATVFTRGFAAGVVGLAAAAFAYAFLDNREYAENVAAIRNKLWRKPDMEDQPVISAEDTAQ